MAAAMKESTCPTSGHSLLIPAHGNNSKQEVVCQRIDPTIQCTTTLFQIKSSFMEEDLITRPGIIVSAFLTGKPKNGVSTYLRSQMKPLGSVLIIQANSPIPISSFMEEREFPTSISMICGPFMLKKRSGSS